MKNKNNDSLRIDRIEVCYHRENYFTLDSVPSDAKWGSFVDTREEKLTVDRAGGTVGLEVSPGSGRRAQLTYTAPEKVAELLDGQYAEYFLANAGLPREGTVYPRDKKRDYTITCFMSDGGSRMVSGSFDGEGLPEDYARLVEDVMEIIDDFGRIEMFSPDIYEYRPRNEGDIIFVNVIFERDGKRYCYRTEDDSLERGDIVVVPTGKDDNETLGVIDSIEYHPKEDSPFPFEKVKEVLRRCTAEDMARLTDFSGMLAIDSQSTEPLAGITPDEWRRLHSDDHNEAILAQALAGAWNQTDWLFEAVTDDPAYEKSYEEWNLLENQLIDKVILAENLDASSADDSDEGMIDLLRPFMERNGFVNIDYIWYRKRGDE